MARDTWNSSWVTVSTLVAAFLCLLSSSCACARPRVEISKASPNEIVAATPYFIVTWREDGGSQIVWRKADLQILERPAEMSVKVLGQEAEAWRREELSHQMEEDGKLAVTEIWGRPGVRARIIITTYLTRDKPYLAVDLAAENLGSGKKQIDLAYVCRLAPAYGSADKLLGFVEPENEEEKSLLYDIEAEPITTQWGTGELSWSPDGGRKRKFFIPAVSIFAAGHDGGPVLFAENRVSLGFQAGPDGLGVCKRFYLRGNMGDTDDGIDLRDGDGKLPYRFYLGYVEQPSWNKLYLDFYLDAFPHIKGFAPAGTTPLEPGSITMTAGVFGLTPLALEWENAGTRAAASSGASYLVVWYQHGDTELQQKLNLGRGGVAFTKAAGLVPVLWDNVKIAPENAPQNKVKYWDTRFSHRHFQDALYTSADGRAPHKSWEGYACNQDPELSFGKQELEAIKEQFARFGYQAFFLDYYGSGASVDYVSGYDRGRYPFLPDQVSLSAYTKELADWLHENNYVFIANVPHYCLGVVKFSDYYFGDIGPLMASVYKLTIGARPFVATGITSQEKGGLLDRHRDFLWGGLLNGYLTSVGGWGVRGWSYTGLTTEPERTQVLDLNGRNSRFMFDVSQSLVVGGELGKWHLFLGREGRAFATVRNLESDTRTISVPFDLSRMELKPDQSYTVFEWDIDSGANLVGARIPGSQLAEGIAVETSRRETKALLVLPKSEVTVLPYLAAVADAGVYTRCSTGKVVSATWRSGQAKRFAVSIDAPCGRSVTALAVPQGAEPEVNVLGALDYKVETASGTITIEVKHNPVEPVSEVNALQPVLSDAGESGSTRKSVATIVVTW